MKRNQNGLKKDMFCRKGVKYMAMGDLTLGGEHTMQHTYDIFLNCTLESCTVSLTTVTAVN